MTKTIIEILVDNSGSMGYMKGSESENKFLIDGQTRMTLIKKLLKTEIIPTLDYTSQVSIRTFRISLKKQGNRVVQGENDIQLIFEGSFNLKSIEESINNLHDPPLGGTPISAALDEAYDNLKSYPDYDRKIILLTDGEENGGGDYIATAQKISNLDGNNCKIFIVGFSLSEEAETAAKVIASGGLFNIRTKNYDEAAVKKMLAPIKKAFLEDTLNNIIEKDKGYKPVSGTIKKDYTVRKKIRDINKESILAESDSNEESSLITKETIESSPNPKQINTLKIGYIPNQIFHQEHPYKYPVVKVPKNSSFLKLPREGRSSQRGFKEKEFYNAIKSKISIINIENELHLTIPHFNKPYEPDIVLFDETLNLYIDVEIDEPYDGYYRFPTHEVGNDESRDTFFTESGWIVIRFTEKQVHEQEGECIIFIQDVLNSIYLNKNGITSNCKNEEQWDYNQAVRWEKEHYREKYLKIEKFGKQKIRKEVKVDAERIETIEEIIPRTKVYENKGHKTDLTFEEKLHVYRHPLDVTGNAEYISVTTLIERFFPFDLERYIKGKAENENRAEKDVLEEFLNTRDEAAEKGTYLHEQIEKFLTGEKYDSSNKEFKMFRNFYDDIIISKGFEFVEAEKTIVYKKYNIAGMVDAIFKKPNSNDHIILDWKRSKKLVIDGYPKKYGYGYALSELNELDNSSYYKYSLQQNLYRYILEKKYGISISSMKLIVLHENYEKYYIISINKMDKEIHVLLDSLTHKI